MDLRGHGESELPDADQSLTLQRLTQDVPVGDVSQAQIDWFLDHISRNDPAFVHRFVLYMTTQYRMDDLAKVTCPTLIVAAAS